MEENKSKRALVRQSTSISNVRNLLSLTDKILTKYNNFQFIFKTRLHETHSNEILEVCLSDNNKYILTCGDDFTAKLWNTLDGKILHTFYDPEAKIRKICFSKNSKFILTGNDLGTCRIWDINGSLLKSFSNENEYIQMLCFIEDDSNILIISSFGTNYGEAFYRIWDIDGHCSKQNEFFAGRMMTENLIVELQLYLTSSKDITRIVNFENNKKFDLIKGGIPNNSNYFSEVLELILTTSEKKIYLWDKYANPLNEFSFNELKITSSCISKSGEYILVATEDKKVRLLNNTGSLILSLSEHQKPPLFLAISNNSEFILSSDKNETILWDINGRVIARYSNDSYLQGVQFSMDSSKVIIKCKQSITIDLTEKKQYDYWDYSKRICNITNGGVINDKCYFSYKENYSDIIEIKDFNDSTVLQYQLGSSFENAVFSESGKYLLTINKDITIWNLQSSLIDTMNILNNSNKVTFENIIHNNVQTGLSGRIKLWEIKETDKINVIHNDLKMLGFHACKISPDDKYIISLGDFGSTVNIWSFEGKKITKIEDHYILESDKISNWAEFSPDGKMIVFGDSCWNIDGSERFKFNDESKYNVFNPDGGLKFCFSPDSKLIFSGSVDLLCKLWNINGQCLGYFKGHKNVIKSVCFSSDGKYLISASTDGIIIVWDLNGNILQTLEDHKENISSIYCSHDNKYLIAFGGGITVWERKNNSLHSLVS